MGTWSVGSWVYLLRSVITFCAIDWLFSCEGKVSKNTFWSSEGFFSCVSSWVSSLRSLVTICVFERLFSSVVSYVSSLWTVIAFDHSRAKRCAHRESWGHAKENYKTPSIFIGWARPSFCWVGFWLGYPVVYSPFWYVRWQLRWRIIMSSSWKVIFSVVCS